MEPATKSNKDPCRVAVKTSHTDLQDQREGKGWKEKVKHEEEKGTETKLGYGGKELGKEKRFKRKRQAGNPSLCGSRLKSVKIKMKSKSSMGKGNKSELFCILPRQIHKFDMITKSAFFNFNQSNLISYSCIWFVYIFVILIPQKIIWCVWKDCFIFYLYKKKSTECVALSLVIPY